MRSICIERDRTLHSLKILHQDQVEALNKKMCELQSKNETDKTNFLADIESLNEKMNDLNTQLFLKNNKISKMVIEMNKQEIVLQKANEELKNVKICNRELDKKLSDKTNENIGLNDELIEKARNINLLIIERDQMSVEIDNYNSTVIHQQNENTSMKKKIHDLETRIKELNDFLKEKDAETEDKIKKLNISFRQISKERDELKQECQKLNQVLGVTVT